MEIAKPSNRYMSARKFLAIRQIKSIYFVALNIHWFAACFRTFPGLRIGFFAASILMGALVWRTGFGAQEDCAPFSTIRSRRPNANNALTCLECVLIGAIYMSRTSFFTQTSGSWVIV